MPASVLLFHNYTHKISHLLFSKLYSGMIGLSLVQSAYFMKLSFNRPQWSFTPTQQRPQVSVVGSATMEVQVNMAISIVGKHMLFVVSENGSGQDWLHTSSCTGQSLYVANVQYNPPPWSILFLFYIFICLTTKGKVNKVYASMHFPYLKEFYSIFLFV